MAKYFIAILVYFLSLILFLVILPAFIIIPGLYLDKLFGLPTIIFPPYNLYLAVAFKTFGAVWMAWSFWAIIIIGRGNPQEAFRKEILPAAKKLVIVGPYRYSRNPMGLGWFMIMMGIGCSLGSISILFIGLPIFLAIVIFYLKHFEEPNLIKRFGDDYLEYRKKIPMMRPKWQG